jgi:hypothetical protein
VSTVASRAALRELTVFGSRLLGMARSARGLRGRTGVRLVAALAIAMAGRRGLVLLLVAALARLAESARVRFMTLRALFVARHRLLMLLCMASVTTCR